MTPDHTFTLVVSSVGIIGALGGIVAGHYLSRSWQHEQWILDNRKQESRELLTALANVFPAFTRWARDRNPIMGRFKDHSQSKGIEDEYNVATVLFHATLNDRLFIAEDVKKLDLKRRWNEASSAYKDGFDETRLKTEVEAMSASIVSMALKKELSSWARWWQKMKRSKLPV